MITNTISKRNYLLAILVVLLCNIATADVYKSKKHEPITECLIQMVNHNTELKSLLIKSIELAKKKNPDKNTNPAQTIEEYYDFIDWASKAMPWQLFLGNVPYSPLYEQMDQGLTYFYFISDQPLPELLERGYYRNTLQYYEPYRSWLITFVKNWGEYLSTENSWSKELYELVKKDDSFGLSSGWYEDANNWKSFNDFFARRLKSVDQRPISAINDDSIVVSPADSRSQGVWSIDQCSNIISSSNVDGVVVKSTRFKSIAELLGNNSIYKHLFAGGTLTHMYLAVNDYHRYHFPVDGIIKHIEIIQDSDSIGGIIEWDSSNNKYILSTKIPGWQNIQTRGIVIVETKKYGLVGIIPVGMSQVSSVKFEPELRIGQTVNKGEKLGYFLFGGSDFILLFQKDVNFLLTVDRSTDGKEYNHNLMGQVYGKLSLK